MSENQQVLLKVEDLKQHFKMGKSVVKAVDGVSFEVKKGEVFSLVGESGCGKTTTGRSIIRLYEISSGSVYFNGYRIAAGTGSYQEAMVEVKKHAKKEIAICNEKMNSANPTEKEKLKKKIQEIKENENHLIAEQKKKIEKARYDQKHCDNTLKKNHQEPITSKIQMIFQDPISSLNPRMTIREIIAEGMRIKGIKDDKLINDKVYEMLRLVGLVPQYAGRYPHEFSGGQRQRIGIARALVMDPELIIADEPISALDVSVKAQIINLMNDLRNSMNLTILFIAHDLSVVKYFSDKIAVMYFGKIVEMAPADELFKHPLHPYTRSLLSAIPLPDPHYEKKRKRIVYNPSQEHTEANYTPMMREVNKAHFVYCSETEFKKYQKEMKQNK